MTSITKHTNSLKTYTYCILGAHFIALSYFFPTISFTFIGTIITFLLLFKWVELVYTIEQANRNNLILLINATDNANTKKLLLQELWYADLHSLGGEPLNDVWI